jgi:uncharacterized membrane protein YkvA (DUF1232 family)
VSDEDSFDLEAIDSSLPVPARTWKDIVSEALFVLPNVVKLLARLLKDPRIPMRRKLVVGIVAGYIASPIDLIPDFLVGVGKLDDLIIASIAIDYLMRGADESIVREHWDGSIDALDLVRSVFEWAAEILPDSLRRLMP